MATTTTKKKTTTKKAAAPAAGEAAIYTMAGGKAGAIALPAEIFSAKWNADLVHQVVTGMQANARQPIAHTKNRGEVSGGGKKPWKQKGTGRARHGSTRSPIWTGGGVAHGPRKERSYKVKLSKSMKRAALFSVLARKQKDGELILVDSFSFAQPKTKDAKFALLALSKAADASALVTKRTNAALIALPRKDAAVEKSFRNMGNVSVGEIRNLNPVEILSSRYLVIESPAAAFAELAKKSKN